MAEYYNAIPDGVIDDRFGVNHSDFMSPEYQTLAKISATKWEECRGLGRSFGYNRAEGEAETIAPDELIYLWWTSSVRTEIFCSMWGRKRMEPSRRFRCHGWKLSAPGFGSTGSRFMELIRGRGPKERPPKAFMFASPKRTPPCTRRFLGQPKTPTITLRAVSPRSGSQIFLLGNDKPLVWSQQGSDIKISLPATLPGKYAYVFRMGV